MEEKTYKLMKNTGAANIAIGVVTIVLGIVTGVLLIVAGGTLLSGKSKNLF